LTIAVRELFTRSIRPPDEVPNDNDPADVPPATVGPPAWTPGDPDGVVVSGTSGSWVPPTIVPSPWSGWPAEWWTPNWNGRTAELTGTAWACIDFNARNLAAMQPYLVGAKPGLDATWLTTSPDPSLYSCWDEFAKELFWDFQAAGEAFVFITARYAAGNAARFHVLPPWTVNVEMDGGVRHYSVGKKKIDPADICHIRYQGSVDDARGHGPLEAGRSIVASARGLAQYAATITAGGLVPSSILEAPEQMSPDQAAVLRDDWVAQRSAFPGYPAVLSGGLKWTPTALNPKDMALLELAQFTNSQIAVLLGVPPPLMGLPTAGESLTYNTVLMALDQHWRTGLRPMASMVMNGLSGTVLPRGTSVEVNSDSYVQPPPLERAQTYEILNRIVDPVTGQPVLTVDQIRQAERFVNATPLTGVAA
jgi:HK97 family phage portal protein